RRGAKTQAAMHAQLAKLVATVHGLDPDIAALMELENDGYGPESSIAQLVDALNAGGAQWRFVDPGHGPGSDAIRVGLIYRADRVSPKGEPAVLEGGPFGERSRVPLAQAFVRKGGRRDLVVVANHFKSKGCSEASGDDADRRDGQGCWNALRVDSARRLHAWLRTSRLGRATRRLGPPAPGLAPARAGGQPRGARRAAWRLQRRRHGRPAALAAQRGRLGGCLRRGEGGAAVELRLRRAQRAPGPCPAEPGTGAGAARGGRVARQCRRAGRCRLRRAQRAGPVAQLGPRPAAAGLRPLNARPAQPGPCR